MMKSKTTKRALLSSVVALFLCFTMLLGTTFAWFTDSVVSGSNVIIAGNLDIDVEYTLGNKDDNGNLIWKDLDKATDLFKKGLWEPGHTEVVALRITNNGTLALKYAANMNIAEETIGKTKDGADIVLSKILTVSTRYGDATMVETVFSGENNMLYEEAKLFKEGNILGYDMPLLSGETQYLFVKVDMAETIGNEANHNGTNIPEIKFGVNVLASQYTHEQDSFGKDYDKDSTVIQKGTYGGIDWALKDNGTLIISPAEVPAPDPNSGATYERGVWREAVVYDENGDATAIGGYILEDMSAVKYLVIEEGVTSIGSFTAKFPNLTGEVVIPASVTYIGQEAFQNAPLTKLTFAEGGTEALCIAPGAFKKIKAEEVVFPADRPEIHIHCWVFNDCTSLKRITFPANVTTFSGWTHVDYCGMNYVDGWDSQVLARCSALEKITFGSKEVHDKFFSAPRNQGNINAIGGVKIIVNN